MGMFSFVKVRDLECPKCHRVDDYDVQFYFGGCNLQNFEMGDSPQWGDYDMGDQGHRLIVTEGYGSACNGCGGPFGPDEKTDPDLFDVYVENDVITCATWNDGTFPYWLLPHRKDGSEFFVLDDYPPAVRHLLS